MNNYKSLSFMRILKSTIELFISSFFVMYFLSISNNNVPKLGLYYIIVYMTVFLTIYFCKNVCKTNKRINLLRIGIIFNFVYFLLIYLLKEKLVDYIYFMAFIYGLEEGFYYSIYNNIESIGISNEERAKFTGIYTFFKSIISIIFPLIFGSIITESGFGSCTILILFLVITQIIFSFKYKDIKIDNPKKTNIKDYISIVKKSEILKKMYMVCFLNGFIFTGAFKSVVVIYIIKVLNTSLDLGIFTSIFAIISSIIGLLFAKAIPRRSYALILKITTLLTILGLVLLLFNSNLITVVLFNLFQTISQTLNTLIIGTSELNVSNINDVKKQYKVEYFVGMEFFTFVGRILGYMLYIVLGLAPNIIITNSILIVFILIIVLLSCNTIKLVKKVGDI